MEKRYPKVGVGIIVINDGKILMGKRRGVQGDGTWAVPGGHLEFNETWEDCAYRECFEETGVKTKNHVFVGATNDFFSTENKHYITIYMKGEYVEGKASITEPDKFVEVGWFDLQNLPSSRFSPFDNLLKSVKLYEI